MQLAKKEAKVYLACRNKERDAKAVYLIKGEEPNADVVFAELDLCDLDSVHEFAKFIASEEA